MNFLLETNENDPTIYILLIIGAILAIAFYIRSRIASKKASNNDAVDDNINNATKEVVQSGTDEEIIAVIAAAIAMAESENNGLKFRVVSFRRI